MIKIFSFNKIIYLINNIDLYQPGESSIFSSIQSESEMHLVYTELINKNNINVIYFFNKNEEQLFSHFTSMFRIIEAAGGLVKNKKEEWLFIFRNGKWDLPKGKIEKNEPVREAALREVEEECGITNLKILKKLPTTYHTYLLEEKPILKPTYWFKMICNDGSKLKPQTEEGITEVKWLSKKDLQQVYDNTHGSIKEVISVID